MGFMGKLKGVAKLRDNKLAICECPKKEKFELKKGMKILEYKKLEVVGECLPNTFDYYLIRINIPLDVKRKRLTVASLIMDASEQNCPYKFTYYEDFLRQKSIKFVGKTQLIKQE